MKRSGVLLLLLIFASFILGQTSAQKAATLAQPEPIQQGVVVDEVARNSAAEKAGLREGDVLLAWHRGDATGSIQSPFDVSRLAMEQAPRGEVSIKGLRGSEEFTWRVEPGSWGLKTRPRLPENLLPLYLEGRTLAQSGKWTDAAEKWRPIAGQTGDSIPSLVRVWLLSQVADGFAQTHNWKNTDEVYEQVLLETREPLSPVTRCLLLRAWGDTYQQRSDWLNAEKYYQQAISETRKSGPESLIIASTLNDLGAISRSRGDLAKAEAYFRQALEISQKLAPGSLAVAASFNNLGRVASRRGDLGEAEKYFHQALEINQKLTPGSLAVAVGFNNLGNVANHRGDLVTAEKYHRQALEIRQELAPGGIDVSASLDNLGNVAEQRGDLEKAEKYHRQALEIVRRLAPGSLDLADSLLSLGNVIEQRGDLAKAEDCYREALEIRQKLAWGSLDVAVTFNNLGNVARQRGDLSQAEDYHRQALEIRQKLAPGSLDVAFSLNNLGAVAEQRGDLAKAEEYYRQALEIRQKLAPEGLDAAASLNSLGNATEQRGDLAKAENYYRQALEIRQKLASGSLDVAFSLNDLGSVAEQRGNLAKAEEYYRQALDIRKKLAPENRDYAESLAELANILRHKEQLDEAVQLYQQAVNVLEKQMTVFGGSEECRSGFRSNHLDLYMAYIDLLVSQKQTEMAFQVLERSRAQGLLETLRAAHVDIRKGVNVELVEKERSLRELLTIKSNRRMELLSDKSMAAQAATLDKEIQEILNEYQDVEGQIREASPGYAALTQPQPLSAKEVQQSLLDSDSLLLEYALGQEHSYVFAVTQDSIAAFALPKRAEIEVAARELYSLLSDYAVENKNITSQRAGSTQEYTKVVTNLSRIVLGPVAGQLNKKRLLVVSDGALEYIPFAVLSTQEDSGKPLIAEHEIVNLPSISALAVLRQDLSRRKSARKSVAILADPVFDVHDDRLRPVSKNERASPPGSSETDGQSALDRSAQEAVVVRGGIFPRLPFSRREAEAIYLIAQKGDATKALDFEASKATAMGAQLRDYRIVHFATHGLLNNEHPELSGLVFSLVDQQGKSEDGFLRLLDIYNLDLNADLVVLSACQTALGKQSAEEGLVGLTRGFMYAGAPRVLASLWKVDDEATAELMKRFYEGVLKNGQTPAQALRTAQVWMLQQKRWRPPYYWAGFVLQGEWK